MPYAGHGGCTPPSDPLGNVFTVVARGGLRSRRADDGATGLSPASPDVQPPPRTPPPFPTTASCPLPHQPQEALPIPPPTASSSGAPNTYPEELVDQVLESSGRRELHYRLLPARMVVLYVLATTLFREAGYEEVLRELTEGLAWRVRTGWVMPSSVAISKARARLGSAPLAALFRSACVPLAQLNTRGAFYRGWRVVSMDGTTLDTADTASNLEPSDVPDPLEAKRHFRSCASLPSLSRGPERYSRRRWGPTPPGR